MSYSYPSVSPYLQLIEIFELQNPLIILELYQALESNQQCLLVDDGLPIGMVSPVLEQRAQVISHSGL
jgi:hypothetical protein